MAWHMVSLVGEDTNQGQNFCTIKSSKALTIKKHGVQLCAYGDDANQRRQPRTNFKIARYSFNPK
jgi:hypothetical protein